MNLEEIDIVNHGQAAVVVRPHSRIGMNQQDEWIKALEAVSKSGAQRVLIDMKNVDFISSRAIGILLAARTEILRRHGAIGLAHVQPHVEKVFSVARIDELFEKVQNENAFLAN